MKRVLWLVLLAMLLGLPVLMTRPAAVVVAQSGGTTYVVQRGDTLFSIARLHGLDVTALSRANGIVNPSLIYVGQRLVIPQAGATPPAAATGGVYVVRYGDTLYSIARVYGVTPWAIAQANGLHNLNAIYAGQRLTIPGAAAPAPTTPGTTPAPAASTTSWRGDYYLGTEIAGAPLFTRNDRAVSFNWGLQSPDTRLNTDQFAVRWSRTINFRGGVYRFTIAADDGVRLWIDGNLLLDAWQAQPYTTHTAEVILTPGNHLVVVDYFDQEGPAAIQFSFNRLGNAPADTPMPGTGTPSSAAPKDAWLAQYFGNERLEGQPAVTQMEPHIGYDWGLGGPSGVPENFFSVRWTRQAHFAADNYALCAMVDDGVRIYVDGQLVLDKWHGNNGISYCAEVDMTAGWHEIKVEYYEDNGNALIYVWWDRH